LDVLIGGHIALVNTDKPDGGEGSFDQ